MKPKKAMYENDQIDLLEVFAALKRKLWLILLAAFIGGAGAGAFSKLVLIPEYTSTAMLYVLSKETTLTSLADLQIGSQLTKDYRIIVTSRPVLQDVIQSLELQLDYKELRKKLTLENPSESRILTITVTDPDPKLAKLIVDKVASTASDYIGEIMEMVPPKLIEDREVAIEPEGPNNLKNAIMGALAGGMLVCGILTMGVVLNDTIQTEEDVEKYLNLTVLASVPLREGEPKKAKEKEKELKEQSAKKQNARKKEKRKLFR